MAKFPGESKEIRGTSQVFPKKGQSEHIEIDLGDGFTAMFDLEDMDKISRYKWVPFHNDNYWLS
jgi:hypothetical protein